MAASGETMTGFSGHRRFAAFWDWATRHEDKTTRALRRKATAGAHGRVLELGVGVGANWPYLPSGIEYVGIEPDPYMLARARQRAARLRSEFELHEARAEQLPFDDRCFDVVLVTLTLCTVQDVSLALAEARRVLKPGGELVFVEHVRPEGRLTGWFSDRITPLWRRVGAGCNPNRVTARAIPEAGLEVIAMERRRVNGLPMIVGSARKPVI